MTATFEDKALLRRFEPVMRYTKGEEFFPMDVESYLSACSLHVRRSRSTTATRLATKGELTPDKLAETSPDEAKSVYYLKFADPLTVTELATYKLKETLAYFDEEDVFHTGPGRLARVGYFSRFADALFSVSLLGRGRVPGDAAAAATLTYQDILRQQTQHYHRYYGRVVRENGWLVLQYWFFYAFNNWRSGFYGFNDHEADWEMACIYLSETPKGEVTPEWVAYASHDFYGDDLRRRWDDPELEKEGEHPVIYSGAGSHSSYYTAGEYLIEIEIPLLSPIARLTAELQATWQDKFVSYFGDKFEGRSVSHGLFKMPFVDYARGDGIAIGPNQQYPWHDPCVITQPPPWVSQYRGLWGLYTQDPLAGENAPAGPMYNRDGTVRRAWYDPLGWAGLDKVPPFYQRLDQVLDQRVVLADRQITLDAEIKQKSIQLLGLGTEIEAIHNQPHLEKIYSHHQAENQA
ncbi:MAG: hypothetical protein AAF485_09280, partial [Chloroflexota bacterium]